MFPHLRGVFFTCSELHSTAGAFRGKPEGTGTHARASFSKKEETVYRQDLNCSMLSLSLSFVRAMPLVLLLVELSLSSGQAMPLFFSLNMRRVNAFSFPRLHAGNADSHSFVHTVVAQSKQIAVIPHVHFSSLFPHVDRRHWRID